MDVVPLVCPASPERDEFEIETVSEDAMAYLSSVVAEASRAQSDVVIGAIQALDTDSGGHKRSSNRTRMLRDAARAALRDHEVVSIV